MARMIGSKELKADYGCSEWFIRQLYHMQGSPFFQMKPGGKARAPEDAVQEFFKELAKKGKGIEYG
ncbi:MAG: hypothetical protein K6E47_00170 [Lachnospiraceae bacterium]|nr:hypothetical protein [Lachnospiraceae bacterium]